MNFHEIYSKNQTLNLPTTEINQSDLQDLEHNWQDVEIPQLQREVADKQLEDMREGKPSPVFSVFLDCLEKIEENTFSMLDAACASGYYSEVIESAKQDIEYEGSDYSHAMIGLAEYTYPGKNFSVNDITDMRYEDDQFDCVFVSGVLEHVKDYRKAMSEVRRVAKKYILIHRLPLTDDEDNRYTKGSQYNIATGRTFFSREVFMKELQGFVEVYSGNIDSGKSYLFKKEN